jgi:4-amino-4-deoxychorismate mutase
MNQLDECRARLDALDAELLDVLGRRFATCREIARFKSRHDVPMMQPMRVAIVRERYVSLGAEAGLPAGFASDLYELILGATCAMEDQLIAALGSGIEVRTS